MKKAAPFIMALLAMLFIFGCHLPIFYMEAIFELNESFNGEFELAQSMPSVPDYDSYDTLGFQVEMGFGGYTLKSNDGFSWYNIGGFPDCLDDYAVIGFHTSSPKYEVFGFSVGSSPNDAESTLIERGFTKGKEQVTGSAAYTLGKITLSVYWDCDGGVGDILGFYIILEVTNVHGVSF